MESTANLISVQKLYRPVLHQEIPSYPDDPEASEAAQYQYRWWNVQFLRMKKGWMAPDYRWINPFLYFFINWFKIDVEKEDEDDSEMTSPYYRDEDQLNADLIYNTQQRVLPDGTRIEAQGIIKAKGRRVGWTTIEVAYFIWMLLFGPDRLLGRLYPDEDNIDDERGMLREAFNSLPKAFRMRETKNHGTQEIEWVVDNRRELRLGYYLKDEKGEKIKDRYFRWKPNKAILFAVASRNAGPFRGKKMGCISIVEAGKWSNLKEVHSAQKECFRQGDRVFGRFLIGGTSDAISIESTTYRDMFYNAPVYSLIPSFTSAAKVRTVDLLTGESNIAAGTRTIMENRARLMAIGDDEALARDKQENPLTPEEAFIPKGRSDYPDFKINEQLEWLLQNKIRERKIRRGRLEWKLDAYRNRIKEVEFIEDTMSTRKDEGGMFYIYEDGFPNAAHENMYVCGIDDVFLNKDEKKEFTSKDSKNALVMWREHTHLCEESDLPVMIYYGRKASVRDTYDDFHKAVVFYKAKIMYELTRGAENSGFIEYMKKRRELDRFIKFDGNLGVNVKDKDIVIMTSLTQDRFDDDGHKKIYFSEILYGYKEWRAKNNDIASATHLAELGMSLRKEEVARRQERRVEAYAHNVSMFNYGAAAANASRRSSTISSLKPSQEREGRLNFAYGGKNKRSLSPKRTGFTRTNP